MAFVTQIDYSNNRQIKQFQLSNTQLSGTTTFGVDDVLIPMNITGDTINIDALQYIRTRGLIFPNSISEFTGTTYQLLGRDNDTGKIVEITGLSGGTSGGTANTDDYTTGTTLTGSILEFTRLSGGTYNVDLSGLTGTTGTANTNDYITGSTFNTSNGDLTLTRLSGGTVVENLDGRYLSISALTNTFIYVGDVTGNDGTAENFNILQPYKTLDAAIIAFKAEPVATEIRIIENSNTYTITEDLIEQTGTTVFNFTQSFGVSGTITFSDMDFCNGSNQTIGTLMISLPDFTLTLDDTTTLLCTRSVGTLEWHCDIVNTGSGGTFLGLRAAGGYFNVNELNSESSSYVFANVSILDINVTTMNFNSSLGRLISFSNTVDITFQTMNITDDFRFINFLNPGVGDVTINHGDIVSTATTAHSLSTIQGNSWTINFNDSIIQGNYYWNMAAADISFIGNGTYEDSDYLFNDHDTTGTTITLKYGEITVDKLVNANWGEPIIIKKEKINVVTELGTAITGSTHFTVSDVSVINQSTEGELFDGVTGSTITLNAPLFINTGTTTSNSTVIKYITEL